MNKIVFTFAVLPLLCLSSASAMAQSTVTIYGIVDAGVSYKDAGAGKVWGLDSGMNSDSRLGFKGSENLDGGMKANFNLEMGFKLDSGVADSTLFARTAWVGLASEDFGSVELGRHKSLTYIYGSQIDPFMDGLLGKTHLMFKINNRRDNSVTYISNNVNGFSAAAQYGFGEKVGTMAANRVASVAGAYANGPLLANIVWDQVKDANGNKAVGGQIILAGVSYDLGRDFYGIKLNAMYEEITGSTSLLNLAETKEQLYVLGGTIKDGASTYIASYTSSKMKTRGDANSNRVAFGYTYDLSKRTNLYTSVARVQNDKTVKTLADVNGATARLFNVGIRHKF